MGFVYLAHLDNYRFKIGMTSNLQNKLQLLRSQGSPDIQFYGVIQTGDPLSKERELQRRYKEFCFGGEWFKFPLEVQPEVLAHFSPALLAEYFGEPRTPSENRPVPTGSAVPRLPGCGWITTAEKVKQSKQGARNHIEFWFNWEEPGGAHRCKYIAGHRVGAEMRDKPKAKLARVLQQILQSKPCAETALLLSED